MKEPVFSLCTAADIDQLIEIGIETYRDTFAGMTGADTMASYLAESFNAQKIFGELANRDSQFIFLHVGGELAGYLKVNENEAQTDVPGPAGLEIERIYLRRRFQGQGMGRTLLEKGLQIAREKRKTCVWLGVWERNEKAIGFYERMGFRKAGTHDFFMGTERQTDFVMRMDLS
jgi:ribosomal protein S18 acetylase RimI-like enzyme